MPFPFYPVRVFAVWIVTRTNDGCASEAALILGARHNLFLFSLQVTGSVLFFWWPDRSLLPLATRVLTGLIDAQPGDDGHDANSHFLRMVLPGLSSIQ